MAVQRVERGNAVRAIERVACARDKAAVWYFPRGGRLPFVCRVQGTDSRRLFRCGLEKR